MAIRQKIENDRGIAWVKSNGKLSDQLLGDFQISNYRKMCQPLLSVPQSDAHQRQTMLML
ncbi:hypothetical protein RA27_20930 [Ruegeria sp. ANG-R]|nr:hypothetical protein RA27_20930 [Ruegeria sp. ANG-R]